MSESQFVVAGKELDWPIASAAGLTNHPDIEVVANRMENLFASGISLGVGGSFTLGEARGGNGFVKSTNGWEYLGDDEYVDLTNRAGFNAKGLPGPGSDVGMSRLDDLLDIAWSKNVEFALSFSPHSGQPLEELKEILSLAKIALGKGVLYVEVNLSCPNLPDRPAFYKDREGVRLFNNYLLGLDPLMNRYGYPGIYPKYGPFEQGEFVPDLHMIKVPSVGGRVFSNTLGNQEPKLADGSPAIKVNNGKAGMSGPALNDLGLSQLKYAVAAKRWLNSREDVISVLGASNGYDVKNRCDQGANLVQLGSVLYWPELVGCESPAKVIEQIKQEFIEAAA